MNQNLYRFLLNLIEFLIEFIQKSRISVWISCFGARLSDGLKADEFAFIYSQWTKVAILGSKSVAFVHGI